MPIQATGEPAPGDGSQPPIPDQLPILPIRGTVMFPGTVMPLGVGRPSSRALLDESLSQSKVIGVVAQRDEDEEDPNTEGLYNIGCAAVVLKLVRQPDETVSIIVHGVGRIRLEKYAQQSPFFRARVSKLEETSGNGKKFEAAVSQLREQARELIELSPNAPEQALTVLMNIESPGNLADFLAANLNIDVQQKQDLLEELDVAKRVRAVHQHVSAQLEIVRLQRKIQQDVQSSISEGQRTYFLREQMKAIQRELGEDEEGEEGGLAELREKLAQADPPDAVMKEAEKELKRLESIPPVSPEYSLLMSYLELVAELPWNEASEDQLDLDRARRILDRDHFDLESVKKRLIEYLAVRKLNPEGRGPILCLVGPPGVGKTSLGRSIADALGRKFARLSLGGIRDEAEVRGHRRTYIGAMPGRIIQEIRRAGTNNPVMMLDEVDKLGADYRGDPTSALLEVLDPRQNNAFVDRYLDVPFDLSQVIFICTANYMGHVPPAFQDRLETIEIPGYTDHDKLQIARRYLVPRQLKENGLKQKQCRWLTSGIRKIIQDYTRESGVRELERQIGSVCRGVAAEVAAEQEHGKPGSNGRSKSRQKAKGGNGKGKAGSRRDTTTTDATSRASQAARAAESNGVYRVDDQLVRGVLGPEKHARDEDIVTRVPGVVVGLAYTPHGGEILFVEAAVYSGTGKVSLTGHIGDVMKESATAAVSLFKSRGFELGYDVESLAKKDLHIHVPAGAVPKDGPSAGVAMFVAVASLLLDRPVRAKLAMTGEITLRGRVLAIGGIKEKTLAAARAGVKTILLPKANERDMEEIDDEVKKKCRFVFVQTVDEVLEHALTQG